MLGTGKRAVAIVVHGGTIVSKGTLMEESITGLVIHCDKQTAEELNARFTECRVDSRAAQRKNLDGDLAAWAVVATVTIRTLPAVLNSIKEILVSRRVGRIQFGELQVENPRAKDVDAILDVATRKGVGSGKKGR